MQIRKLYHSTIFRLTLLNATFFCVSVIALLTFVYFATVREMESQIRHRIGAQLNEAQTTYNAHGLERLKEKIGEFIEEEDEGLGIYLLTDVKGKALAGNMESWPEDMEYADSWMYFDIDSKSDEAVHVVARDSSLQGGYRLLVGYSLRGPDRARHVLLDVVMASIALTLFITAMGGAFFSRVIRRRLERVNVICAQVISGNLDVKVPVAGSNDEFDHLASNVNAMLGRIAELVRGLRQTSDNVAHDLRTPLNRHRIRLEGIIKHPPVSPEKLQEQMKAGIEEVDSVVETLNSILRISQAQAGVASQHFTTFDLSSVMVDVVEFYSDFAEQKHIEMHDTVHPGIPVHGDKPLITQSIANLIDNAIKYTPGGGRITVGLTQSERMIECVIADNGPGIPPEFYAKVKERFFRMEASRTSPGTGLGLALVDAVAKLHKGELEFSDNQPGLKVTLRLPIAPEEFLT